MLVVKVNKGARKDLGRPTTTPIENKEDFVVLLQKSSKPNSQKLCSLRACSYEI